MGQERRTESADRKKAAARNDSVVVHFKTHESSGDQANPPAPEFLCFEFHLGHEEQMALYKELLECIRGFSQRSATMERTRLQFLDLELDLLRRTAVRAGRTIKLSQREFDILEYFMRRPERVLTRDNIFERVWGLTYEDNSNVLEVYMSRIRRKINNGFATPLIKTVRGLGYMLSRNADE